MLRQSMTALTLATLVAPPTLLLTEPPPALAQSVQTDPQPQGTAPVSAGYLLGVGDEIRVEVFNA
ncbi:MAG: hypothetical protein WBA10_04315, partial [Elainellaceae cyanobacterium]